MDTNYVPDEMETRTLFGLQMQQRRNDARIVPEIFNNIVTQKKEV